MASEINFGGDGDFNDVSFCMRINADLADDIGNLAQRVLTMINKNCDSKIPAPGTPLTEEDEAMIRAAEDSYGAIREAMYSQNVKYVCETIVNVAKQGNKYIDVQAPWTLRKTDVARFNTVVYVLTESIRRIAVLLQPLVPSASSNLLDQIGASDPYRSFASLHERIPPGTTIGTPSPVFPKLVDSTQDATAATTAVKASKGTSTDKEKKKSKSTSSSAVSVELVGKYSQLPVDELVTLITETGVAIRQLKSQEVVPKVEIQQKVALLLALKER